MTETCRTTSATPCVRLCASFAIDSFNHCTCRPMAGKQPGQVARFACSGIFQPSDPPRIDLKLLNTTTSKEHRQRSATASGGGFREVDVMGSGCGSCDSAHHVRTDT